MPGKYTSPNKQRNRKQGFKEASTHEGKSSATSRTGTGKITCSNEGKRDNRKANYADSDSFLGAKTDSKLGPAKGSRSPKGPGSAKGQSAPASPSRPKAAGSGMKRTTTSYGAKRGG